MKSEFDTAAASLDALASSIPAPWGNGILGQATGNWTFPPLSTADFQSQLRRLATEIRSLPDDLDPSIISEIAGIPQRASWIQSNVMPNFSNNVPAVGSILSILISFIDSLIPAAVLPNWEKVKEADLFPREISKRIRNIESSLDRAAPRVSSVEQQVKTISGAYEAAKNLPTDLASLEEAKGEIEDIRNAVAKMSLEAKQHIKDAAEMVGKIKVELEAAEKAVKGIDSAYSAATTIGLSASFSARADELRNSVKSWVMLLIGALIIGGALGYLRLTDFQDLIRKNAADHWLWLNAGMSFLTVAAPIWFAWLSTRQINQRFRLAEDYAFKASVAKAYEGYRREAARLNPDLEARLFASALDRLDEPPLRFISHEEHGSPYEALLSNTGFQKALEKLPSLRETLQTLLQEANTAAKKSAANRAD